MCYGIYTNRLYKITVRMRTKVFNSEQPPQINLVICLADRLKFVGCFSAEYREII